MEEISQIRFINRLKDFFFHDGRKYESDEVKQKAFDAMLLLWNSDNMNCCGYIYTQELIRHVMLNKMMPRDLDEAIKWWKKFGETSVDDLCQDLLLAVVLKNSFDLFHKALKDEIVPIEYAAK